MTNKRLDELELRVARLEKWLDTLKEHAARKPSSASSKSDGPSGLAQRVERIGQALVSNFNVDVLGRTFPRGSRNDSPRG